MRLSGTRRLFKCNQGCRVKRRWGKVCSKRDGGNVPSKKRDLLVIKYWS